MLPIEGLKFSCNIKYLKDSWSTWRAVTRQRRFIVGRVWKKSLQTTMPKKALRSLCFERFSGGIWGVLPGKSRRQKSKGQEAEFWRARARGSERGGGVCSKRTQGLYSEWATESCKVPEQGCDVGNIRPIAPWTWDERRPQHGEINLKTHGARAAEGAAPAKTPRIRVFQTWTFRSPKTHLWIPESDRHFMTKVKTTELLLVEVFTLQAVIGCIRKRRRCIDPSTQPSHF